MAEKEKDQKSVAEPPDGLVSVQEILGRLEQDRYFSVKGATEYVPVSTKTLRRWMKQGLPYYQVNGKVLLRRSEIDDWLAIYRVQNGDVDLDKALELAESLMSD